MPALLYYLPGAGGSATIAELMAAGLGYVCERSPVCTSCLKGPDGPGRILAQTDDSGAVAYQPDRQTWQRIPGTAAWVGIYREARPDPTDLVRLRPLDGHVVRLADGQDWLVPVARAVVAGEEIQFSRRLPALASLDADGNWVSGDIVPRYAPLWEIACRFWDALMGAEPAEGRIAFTFAGLLDGAVTALQANYRIGRAEAALLGLLDEQVAVEVLKALVDWPTVEAWIKKKAAAGGSATGTGEAA